MHLDLFAGELTPRRMVNPDERKRYESRLKRLSVAHLQLGLMSIVAQAGSLHIEKILHWRTSGTYAHYGFGFWCGGLYVICGLSGIFGLRALSRPAVITCYAVSIFCEFAWLAQFICAAVNVSRLSSCYPDGGRFLLNPSSSANDGKLLRVLVSSTAVPVADYCTDKLYKIWMATDSLQMVFSAAEFAVSVMTTVYLGKAYP